MATALRPVHPPPPQGSIADEIEFSRDGTVGAAPESGWAGETATVVEVRHGGQGFRPWPLNR